jgi:hypothetical protein
MHDFIFRTKNKTKLKGRTMGNEYEKDIKDLIQRFSAQQAQMNPGNIQKVINDHHTGIDNQGPENDPPPKVNPTMLKPGPPPKPAPVENGCPQCGIIHPPLRPGEKCPMADVKVQTKSTAKSYNVNEYLVTLRNILISQIEKNNIEDVDKLFKNIIVEITKYLEEYKE